MSFTFFCNVYVHWLLNCVSRSFNAPHEESKRGTRHAHYIIHLAAPDLQDLLRKLDTLEVAQDIQRAMDGWITRTCQIVSWLQQDSVGSMTEMLGVGVPTPEDAEEPAQETPARS